MTLNLTIRPVEDKSCTTCEFFKMEKCMNPDLVTDEQINAISKEDIHKKTIPNLVQSLILEGSRSTIPTNTCDGWATRGPLYWTYEVEKLVNRMFHKLSKKVVKELTPKQ